MDRQATAPAANRGSVKTFTQTNFTTSTDAIEQFKAAMQEAGILPPENIIGDGALHRFKIEGKLNGWYSLHLDGKAAGSFGDWKQGIKERWKLAGNFKPPTDAERKAFAIERQRQEAERQAKEDATHNTAANKAKYIWSKSTPITAQDQHPYLVRKQIQPHGARLSRGALVNPIFNANNQLVNLQFIDADGGKIFLKGGKKKGCFSVIGKHEDGQPIVICEGYATGATLHAHTGHFVIVALDAGNLEPVAKSIRILAPTESIIIAGDNDLSAGVGQKAARAAALAVGGKYIIPATPGHDWNDSLTTGVA